MNIQYKLIGKNEVRDLQALIKLYEDVFEMENFIMPNTQHLQSLLLDRNIIFYTAIADDIVIGGLTAYLLPSVYFPSSEVYIFDLAVKTAYQRKGIGRNLIASLKEYCVVRGYKEIFVQAEVEDQHAIDFYRATGGLAESVVHFSYTLNQ